MKHISTRTGDELSEAARLKIKVMFTDASFEIMLPVEFDLSTINMERPVYEYAGVLYPQDTAVGSFGANFKSETILERNTNYTVEHLPVEYKNIKWQVLRILGDGLGIFENSLLGLGKEEPGYGLMDLLQFCLIKSSVWVAVFEPQYDGFSNVIRGDIQTVMEHLRLCLLKGYPGFLVYK